VTFSKVMAGVVARYGCADSLLGVMITRSMGQAKMNEITTSTWHRWSGVERVETHDALITVSGGTP
jgi:hypothetical protein